jgi:endonuclease/exonuclease/phosphatase family metal-dependent hydrolase
MATGDGYVRSRTWLGAAAAVVGLAAVLVPGGAAVAASRGAASTHHSKELAQPTGVHVVAVSSSSIKVATHRAANARRYRLFASTDRNDLWTTHISRARASAPSARPIASLGGLPFTTAPYYYRVEVLNGPHHRFSKAINEVGLRPARPSALRVATRTASSYLTWSAGAATGFAITRSSSPNMAANRHTYRILGSGHQFTPPGLARGRTYYFQVRALNERTPSSPSNPIRLVAHGRQQAATVMTYNILEATNDGHREGSGRVASWGRRKAAAASLINRAKPDVVAIQEGSAWVGRVRGPRQVDSLRAALHGRYALAHTEIAPSQPHYFRTGVYILYKKSAYKAVGHGNHWALGNNRYAAFQELRSRATGARMLFVSTHLVVGNGSYWDGKREAETNRMIAAATARARRAGIPVVYAGDFNSDVSKMHAFDGPGVAMRAASVANAFDVAQSRSKASYNSANGYQRRPPRAGDHIDDVYTAPGVSVRSWRLLMNLRHGELVGVIPSDHNPLVARIAFPF